MAQKHVQIKTEDEFKTLLTDALNKNQIDEPKARELISEYKAALKQHGPPLSKEQFDNVDSKVDSTIGKLFRGTIGSLFGAIPTVDAGEQEKVITDIRDSTRDSLIRAEQFRITDPEQAALIDSLNPVESFMIGMGSGLTKIGRGLAGIDNPEDEKKAMRQLKEYGATGSAAFGEIAGESLPFIVPGMGAGALASIPLRAAAATGVGVVEGFAIGRGESDDPSAGGKGAVIGGGIALAMEVGVPVIGKLGGALFRKLTGNAPKAPIVDGAGNYTEEFLSTIHENGLTPDDFMADVQNVVSGQGNDELSNAVADTVTAIKSQSGRDLKAIAASPDIDPKVLASAERLGVAGDLPISAMSRNQQYIDLEQGISSIIGSQTGARQVNAIKTMKDKADESIEILGGTIDDAQGLSDRVLSSLMTTRSGLDDQAETLYRQIGERVPPQLNVGDVTPLRDYISNQRSIFGDDLNPIDKELAKLLGSESNPKLVTYGMVDRARKRVGAQIKGKDKPFGDMDSAEAKQAYSMLTDLQGQFLDSVDAGLLPSATDKESLTSIWSSAKDLTKTRKALEDSIVTNFGKGGEKAIIPTLEVGLMRIPRGGLANFNKAIEAVPPEMREEAVATALNRVFTAGSGQSQMNMGGFTRWYEKLNRNKTSKEALFSHLSSQGKQRMEDMFAVSQGFSNALLNKKDTGRVATLFDNYDKPNGLLDKLYYGGGGVDPGTSAVVQVVKTAADKDKQNLAMTADRLLSAPTFKQMVVSAMDDPASAKAQKQLREITKSKVYNDWVDALPRNSRVNLIQVGLLPFLLGDEEQEEAQ